MLWELSGFADTGTMIMGGLEVVTGRGAFLLDDGEMRKSRSDTDEARVNTGCVECGCSRARAWSGEGCGTLRGRNSFVQCLGLVAESV